MTTGTDHGIGEAVAARIERRWAVLSIVIVGILVGMAAFIGIHQATMPQGRVETADQIIPALERAFKSGKPAMINVVGDVGVGNATLGGNLLGSTGSN